MPRRGLPGGQRLRTSGRDGAALPQPGAGLCGAGARRSAGAGSPPLRSRPHRAAAAPGQRGTAPLCALYRRLRPPGGKAHVLPLPKRGLWPSVYGVIAAAEKHKKEPPLGSRQNWAKKEAALDCDPQIFHTAKGYFSTFLVSSIMVTSLSSDFSLLCRSRDSQSASQWVLFPVLKSEACFLPSFPLAHPQQLPLVPDSELAFISNGLSSFVALI